MFDKLIATLPHARPDFGAAVRRLFRTVELVLRVRRERRELAALDDRMLKDVGLSRSLADIETSRDLLDLPEERLRRHLGMRRL